MDLRRALVLAGLLLTACQSPMSRPGESPLNRAAWDARQATLAQWSGFDLEGRIAVTGSALSGNLVWRQRGEQFYLRLAGPFGSNALLIEGSPQSAAIRGKDLDLVTTTPEQTLAERTGWQLPLAALRHWVLGRPAPGSVATVVLDGDGRPAEIRQADWQLHFEDYPEGRDAIARRIVATRSDTVMTVLIKRIEAQP